MPRHSRQNLADLERELLELERTDPAVSAAARALDRTVRTMATLIMVDELRPCPNAPDRCFRAGACHLTVHGPIEALHNFAAKLGMRRSWFQDHRVHPHYDLTSQRREAALALGARFVPAKTQAKVRLQKLGALP
jgi:hypothetical protein